MIKLFRHNLHKIASYMELSVAVIITVMVGISIINMIIHIYNNPMEIQDSEGFYQFMNDALSLIVGIEFLKMIIIPTSDNVIETLLFAVSRHVILDHELAVMIVGIICVGILFIIRKYLFVSFEENETHLFRGSNSIRAVNKALKTNIKVDNPDEKLSDFLTNKLKEEGYENPKKDLEVHLDNLVMKVAAVNSKGQITEVEILKEKKKAEKTANSKI